MSDAVVVAFITGSLSLVGVIWQSRKTRRINSFEHNSTLVKIDRIENKIDRVDFRTDRIDAKLEDHLADHHEKTIL